MRQISWFQFQTGAIKRNNLLRGLQPRIFSFNSKLVRLKVLIYLTGQSQCRQFQFQTGAIKSIIFRLPLRGKKWFQFQTGAIKSECGGIIGGKVVGFNSKLVRLKGKSARYKRRR